VACLAKHAKGGKGKGKGKGKAEDDEGGEEAEATYVEVDIEDVKRRMQGAVDTLHREFTAISAGRATPTMLDGIMVAGEGGAVALPTVAKVLLQGAQGLQVSVFEPGMVAAVCKAIEEAEMGLVPEVQGKMLKVTVPRMTTEARELLVKQARKLGEASKTSVRNVRQAAMKRAKGHPSKEERKRSEKEVEAATSAATAKVTAAVEAKEKDVKKV